MGRITQETAGSRSERRCVESCRLLLNARLAPDQTGEVHRTNSAAASVVTPKRASTLRREAYIDMKNRRYYILHCEHNTKVSEHPTGLACSMQQYGGSRHTVASNRAKDEGRLWTEKSAQINVKNVKHQYINY